MGRRGIDWSQVNVPATTTTFLASTADTYLEEMPEVVRAAYELSTMSTMSFEEALFSLTPVYENKLVQENRELVDSVGSWAQKTQELEQKLAEMEELKNRYESNYRLFLKRTDEHADRWNQLQTVLDAPFGKGGCYKSAGDKLRAIKDLFSQ